MMAVSPVLLIKKIDDSVIKVRARFYNDFTEHNIVLNSVLSYWRANNLPPALKFLELFDSVIKRTVNELMPHKTLNLKYEVNADQILEKASKLEVNILSLSADDVSFKLDDASFSLINLKKIDDDFESKTFNATFDQSIITPDIVLEKYRQMQNKN